MTVQEIAARLAELCRQGAFETAQKELYANEAVSIEPYASPAFEKETRGLDAILEKGRKFDSMVDTIHEMRVSEPLIAGNVISLGMGMDITMKEQGRMNMEEMAVYTVKDGKIVSEQFFV